MRRSSGTLSGRDAYRTLWQQQKQQPHRPLSSATIYPGYAWPGASSASAPASSSLLPLSIFSTGSSSSNSKVSRSSRPWLTSLAYSTSNPAYPRPGSNNDIDPLGVDYSVFEPEDAAYSQYASTSLIAGEANESQHDTSSSSLNADSSINSLSPPAQLLIRLIRDKDFETATTVLEELKMLHTPLNELMPDFAPAALWAIQNGKKTEMIYWMRLCPGYTPGTRRLETASAHKSKAQVASVASYFRKCFIVLLDSYGDDLRLLQRASMLAVEKGMWSVLQSTLAQIIRFGMGNLMGPTWSNSILGWQYFTRLIQANQSQRGLKDRGRQAAIKLATLELRALYNLAIRTLALAGRLDDAIYWAEKSTEAADEHHAYSQIVRLELFTEKLLLEELIRTGGGYLDQAQQLAKNVSHARTGSGKRKKLDIDRIRSQIERETMQASAAKDRDFGAARPESLLDQTIQAYMDQGDVVTARDHLLSVLESASRIQYGPDESIPAHDALYADSSYVNFEHLPSARVLSDLHDLANKHGIIPITVSLTETDLSQVAAPDGSHDAYRSQEMLTAEEFLRPVRQKLVMVKGGKGLWQTARLYGYIKKGQWTDAVQYYIDKAGFRVPAGGISMKLISLALDQQPLPKASKREQLNKAQWLRGKDWPSTHAINLMIRAIVGICVDAKDYSRLTQVYRMWREASMPTRLSEEDQKAEEAEELVFQEWLPSQRPDSYTFDPFIRAFGRLNVEVESGSPSSSSSPAAKEGSGTARTDIQTWGSSQAVLDLIRDMTDIFSIRPSISTWTIALECLAREGRSRWTATTSILARAVGINTTSPLSSSYTMVQRAEDNFEPANSVTYTAMLRALIRVPREDGGSMVEEAAAIRDDLLVRTMNLDVAVRQMLLVEAEEQTDEGQQFWRDLLQRWQTVQEAVFTRGNTASDERARWQAAEMIRANGRRTIEAMHELWMLESAAEADRETSTA
ncbi:hypothetical protein NDA14_004920 [Ustilago hordei]|nr:hypothetical protein NDA14_004920 [Ustilago hordei]